MYLFSGQATDPAALPRNDNTFLL